MQRGPRLTTGHAASCWASRACRASSCSRAPTRRCVRSLCCGLLSGGPLQRLSNSLSLSLTHTHNTNSLSNSLSQTLSQTLPRSRSLSLSLSNFHSLSYPRPGGRVGWRRVCARGPLRAGDLPLRRGAAARVPLWRGAECPLPRRRAAPRRRSGLGAARRGRRLPGMAVRARAERGISWSPKEYWLLHRVMGATGVPVSFGELLASSSKTAHARSPLRWGVATHWPGARRTTFCTTCWRMCGASLTRRRSPPPPGRPRRSIRRPPGCTSPTRRCLPSAWPRCCASPTRNCMPPTPPAAFGRRARGAGPACVALAHGPPRVCSRSPSQILPLAARRARSSTCQNRGRLDVRVWVFVGVFNWSTVVT
jgi:hypothetical protein